eukprot:9318764-Prorocentrum_lima.AAC.1
MFSAMLITALPKKLKGRVLEEVTGCAVLDICWMWFGGMLHHGGQHADFMEDSTNEGGQEVGVPAFG